MRKIANLRYIEVIRAILIRIFDFNAQKRAKIKILQKIRFVRIAYIYQLGALST